MNGRFLLDTNIIIALFEQDVEVQKRLSDSAEVFCSSIVLGELFYGAFKSKRVESNILRINEFSQRFSILSCNKVTSRYYGKIKSYLHQKGRPIPENDIWIAALCEQYNLVIVTRDELFKEVESIKTEIW